MVTILNFFVLIRALALQLIIVGVLGWLLLFWLPARDPKNWASGSAKALAYLACAFFFVIAAFWLEWHFSRQMSWMVGFGQINGLAEKLALASGPVLGMAIAVGLFVQMFRHVSKEAGESFFTITLGAAGLILLLGSGGLFLAFLVE